MNWTLGEGQVGFGSREMGEEHFRQKDQGQPEPESCVGGCAPFCSTGTKEQGEA